MGLLISVSAGVLVAIICQGILGIPFWISTVITVCSVFIIRGFYDAINKR